MVDGAIEQLPPALVEQVRVGGRVVTGIVERGVVRLATGRRTAGGFGLKPFADMECVTLPGFAIPPGFRF
jgi:protein-L-isoaspartate(D-aspartate) O-methyltransferase